MARASILEQIQALDPERDHQRIVFLSKCYDFAFDTVRALEFALYRTYCVPSISGLLDRTGEFLRRPQKRYDDTDIIVSELMEWGYDSDRGRAALRRMNQIHGRFAIANDDFLYVLSTFIFEPIRWNARFGWRPMCEQERLGYFYFWREVGRRMNIKEIPDRYDEFERFNVEYERTRFHFAESNQRIGAATRDLFLSWYPGAAASPGPAGDLRPDGRPADRGLRLPLPLGRAEVPGRRRLEAPRPGLALAPRPAPPPPPDRDAPAQLSARLPDRGPGPARDGSEC
jgi:hypothetical protein